MKEAVIKRAGEKLSVSLACEIDHHTARIIREAVDKEISAGAFKEVVLDFSGVSFMDSSGLGLILGRAEKAAGALLVVTGLSYTLLRVVRMSGIEKHKSISIREPNKQALRR